MNILQAEVNIQKSGDLNDAHVTCSDENVCVVQATLTHQLERAIYSGLSVKLEPLVESSWVGHVPFLHTLIAQFKPKSYFELGVFNGCSYFAASAALKQHGGGQCTGVDTWLGDIHCGQFKQGVYNWFVSRKDKLFPESKIIQKTFQDASNDVDSCSIDILHIDGANNYDAVKEDHLTWLPKVSNGGVILFHDTIERQENFGVWKLWEELAEIHEYRFEFEHSHGLGVIVKGNPSPELMILIDRFSSDSFLRQRFAAAGENLVAMTAYHVEKQRAFMRLKAFQKNQEVLERQYSGGNPSYLAPAALASELEKNLYLDLVKNVVLNSVYEPGIHIAEGKEWPKGDAMTMVGKKRLENALGLALDVIERNIPGDFIEAGVWRGGVVALWAALLKTQDRHNRKVIGADSFKGIPPVKVDQFPDDAAHIGCDSMEILTNNSKAKVEGYLSRLGLDVVLVEGWFDETLASVESESFSLIRADGDTQESTIQILENLYPKLSIGGYVIIDDYFSWSGCRAAVDKFRQANSGKCGELVVVDWTAIYWRKI